MLKITWVTPNPHAGKRDNPCVSPWGHPQPPRAEPGASSWALLRGCRRGSTLLLGTGKGSRAARLPGQMDLGSVEPALCFPAAALNVPMLP